MGAAAAFCGAAKRSVDPARARPGRRACDDASHVRIAEDIAGTDDHRELSPGYRVNGSANGISRAGTPPRPPCFGDVRSTVRVPRCESRGLTNGDSSFYPLGHKALFRHLTDEAPAARTQARRHRQGSAPNYGVETPEITSGPTSPITSRAPNGGTDLDTMVSSGISQRELRMNMTKKQRARRSAIIRILSCMSRNGCANGRFDDYTPLERYLRELDHENFSAPRNKQN